MRMAQVAPLFESVPPRLYCGTVRVVSYLTEELVQRGHEVTLFASCDSVTSAALVPACERALWRDPECRETLPHHVRSMSPAFREARHFDIIHFYCDYIHFLLAPLPSDANCDDAAWHGCRHDLKPLFETFPEVPLVSISDDQRAPVPWANWPSGPAQSERPGCTTMAHDFFRDFCWNSKAPRMGHPYRRGPRVALQPDGYHVGGVRPHDNAVIASGMARYGMASQAAWANKTCDPPLSAVEASH